jgi:hypothetical protein
MTITASHQDLGERIERLVQQHIEASRQAAQQAVERAFASTASPSVRARAPRPVRSAGGSKRRAPEEVAAIGERLYEAVCAKPGEGMAVLAAEVGGSVRDLHRPMTLLKRAGRVRSVGSRHLTRYFPMVGEQAVES